VSSERPDPETLLTRAKEEEARKRQGRLKLFFGAAAGVGKTYAMLEAARELKADGIDVVVGSVETHGRAETEALLEGLEILPPRIVAYRGTVLKEFDLDAALARHPAVILVDELAHSNAEGSRHAKRWQDILELLDAGINVYTALNVQHLESLNDLVAKITEIVVRETVPDSVVERADEIELVDLPPDDLIQRLQEGKVYVPQQAQEAIRNFFRKGNLIALRELALRRTVLAISWILGFFAAIVLAGFPIAVPLFVFLYLRIQGKESWVFSVIFTFAVWAFFYALFDRLLHLPFPAGWMRTWLG